MFDLEDELTIESYRIPWLIWIQILVMFLLILFLLCVSFFTSDLTDFTTAVPPEADPSTSGFVSRDIIDQKEKPLAKHSSTSTILVANRFQNTQVGEIQSIKGEMVTNTGRRIVREGGEDIGEGEASTIYYHPCHYINLATLAFLKCFGLDSSKSDCSNRKHRKRKQN